MDRAEARVLYEARVRAGAVVDGMPGWTHSDVPGIPLAGYGYRCEIRSEEGWDSMFYERFLVFGGLGPQHLDMEEAPRTIEDVVEAAATQAADGQTLAARERWLTAAAAAGPGRQESWLRPGAGRYLVPTAVRVTVWTTMSDRFEQAGTQTKTVIERELPVIAPPTRAEIEEYAAETIDADSMSAPAGPPVLQLPVRTDDTPLDGPHFHFPALRYPGPDFPEDTLGGEAALYDGPHRVARILITATNADSLARAQHVLAADLAPWTDSILLLARASRIRTPEAQEIESNARLRADPELSGTWPCPHSEQEIADARATIPEADALTQAAVDALPDASREPLPPMSRSWRGERLRERWRDTLYHLLRDQWAATTSTGRDRLIRWTHHGFRHDLHYTGKIPMQVIHQALAHAASGGIVS
ncbi:hypothetical protein [Streptomyces cinereoruber]